MIIFSFRALSCSAEKSLYSAEKHLNSAEKSFYSYVSFSVFLRCIIVFSFFCGMCWVLRAAVLISVHALNAFFYKFFFVNWTQHLNKCNLNKIVLRSLKRCLYVTKLLYLQMCIVNTNKIICIVFCEYCNVRSFSFSVHFLVNHQINFGPVLLGPVLVGWAICHRILLGLMPVDSLGSSASVCLY